MGSRGRRLLPVLLSPLLVLASPPRPFLTWRLQDGQLVSAASDAPMAVGSLQKPFVAKAWAAAHPGQPAPRISCPPGPGCWTRRGHGELGLVQALSLSCNSYFRNLAAATPADRLQAAFRAEGFLGVPLSPDAAIGRYDGESVPVIRPSQLLQAYLRLVRTPWNSGEEIRQMILAGLREAARSGTAGSLGQHGCWAKTGTLPLDPIRTCGVAVLVDDSGGAILGRLEPGTGREAARRLASIQATREAAAAGGGERVRVRILELLRGRRAFIRNGGTTAIPAAGGFLGAGAKLELTAGQWAGPGLLELQEPKSGLVRRLRGLLAHGTDPGGGTSLILTCNLQDYVAGVIAAELANPADPRRVELGAAVLRFLDRGPRHPDADVCDSTHCAWFVGLGPSPQWPTPRAPRVDLQEGPAEIAGPEWSEMQAKARGPGPSQWSSHCGGRPLSPHALWGGGDLSAPPCPRHHGGQTRAWQRTWTAADVGKAFAAPIDKIEPGHHQGVWVLRVTGSNATRSYSYDEAHRRLARILGWGALPSPADEIVPVAGGFLVKGVGLGHRVGLCLGD